MRLGGGLVVQAVIAYWLHVRFGAGVGVLGPAFAIIALVQAGSYEIAGRLSNRIGLIRTMVFTSCAEQYPFDPRALQPVTAVGARAAHRPLLSFADGRPGAAGIRGVDRAAGRTRGCAGRHRGRCEA